MYWMLNVDDTDIQVILLQNDRNNAAVNGYLELNLLKGRQRFDAISMSNL